MSTKVDNISMARYRGSKFNKVKDLDSFGKVDNICVRTSWIGGLVSIVSFIAIVVLVYLEIKYYLDSKFIFKFSTDADMNAKLKFNLDITVAMPCSDVGADILDSTNENMLRFGDLHEENTWFELPPEQRHYFDAMRYFNGHLREDYHALQELLWREGQKSMFGDMPTRRSTPPGRHDACRIYGTLVLNKVPGNFHVTAGKSIHMPQGHMHISLFNSHRQYNFSHRINRMNYGDPSPGVVHPLEGDEYITNKPLTSYQYFVTIIPTTVQTFMSNLNTYQYSVKELTREINHTGGSHGMPGIFFKYDMSALKITVKQERDNMMTFITRLCATVSGVYVCAGILNKSLSFLLSLVLKDDSE